MIRFVITACVSTICLFGLTGCGGPESLIKKQIGLINEQADAIEKKDAAKFQRTLNEMKEVEQKIKDLNLSPEEKQRLKEKFKGDIEKAMKRLREAAEKDPEFMRKVDPTPPKEK